MGSMDTCASQYGVHAVFFGLTRTILRKPCWERAHVLLVTLQIVCYLEQDVKLCPRQFGNKRARGQVVKVGVPVIVELPRKTSSPRSIDSITVEIDGSHSIW